MKNMTLKIAVPLAASAIALFSAGASADQILGYGQSSSSNTVTISTVGNTTTITSSTAIGVTNYAGGGAPFAAFISLSATNSSAVVNNGGLLEQSYTGTFCITSAAACGGTNYLSGTFIDDFSGNLGGSSFTLAATTPPAANVTFTSDILTAAQLGLDRAVGFSFSNVVAPLAICGTTICSATASQSGTFSANNTPVVPEPGTLALLGLGLLGLGAVRRRV